MGQLQPRPSSRSCTCSTSVRPTRAARRSTRPCSIWRRSIAVACGWSSSTPTSAACCSAAGSAARRRRCSSCATRRPSRSRSATMPRHEIERLLASALACNVSAQVAIARCNAAALPDRAKSRPTWIPAPGTSRAYASEHFPRRSVHVRRSEPCAASCSSAATVLAAQRRRPRRRADVEERLRALEAAKPSLERAAARDAQSASSSPGKHNRPPPTLGAPPGRRRPSEPFAWGDFTWLNGAQPRRPSTSSTPSTSRRSSTSISITPTRSISRSITRSSARRRPSATTSSSWRSSASAATCTSATCAAASSCSTASAPSAFRATTSPSTTANTICYRPCATSARRTPAITSNKLHGINVDVGALLLVRRPVLVYAIRELGIPGVVHLGQHALVLQSARALQIFPTDRLKVELWLINGWQTYGKFNELPGVGYQIRLRAARVDQASCSTATSAPTRRIIPAACASTPTTASSSATTTIPMSKGVSRGAISVTVRPRLRAGRRRRRLLRRSKAHQRRARRQLHQRHAVRAGLRQRHGLQQALVLQEPASAGWSAAASSTTPAAISCSCPTGVAGAHASTPTRARPSTAGTSRRTSAGTRRRTSPSASRARTTASSEPYYAGRGGVTGPDGYKCGGLYNPDGLASHLHSAGLDARSRARHEDKLIFAVLFRM